jgi:NitT/TauT family transport system substrate-binding protein
MVGGTPVGVTAATAAVIAATKGEAIKIVAGEGASTNIGWVVRGDSDLRSIRDVKGKKLGYSAPGSVSQFLVQKCVRDAGIPVSDVQLVALGGLAEQITALKTGLIDVAMSAEPVVTRMEKEIRVLWWAHDFVPEFQQAVIIATDEFIKSDPEILRGFLRAHSKAHEFMETNPEEGARIWAEEVKFPPDIATRGMRNHPKNYFSLKLTVKGLKVLEEGMLEMKAIDRKVEWAKIVDQRFLDPKFRINLSEL